MNVKKGIFYVLIANLINLIISVFTGFILPKYLSIETYANIKLFQLYITYIGILHLGFSDGMYLRHGGKSIDAIDKKNVLEEFKTFKLFQFIVCIIASIISTLLKNDILLFCALVILPINVSNYVRNLYNAIGEFKKYSRYTNINTIMIFIINIILLFIIKNDLYYVYIIAYILVYFAYWLFIENECRKIFRKEKVSCFNIEILKEDIKTGFPLMIGNFCNVIFTSVDRIFVQNLLGTIKFAFYSFAVSVENILNALITPISTVMYNYFCINMNREKVIRVKKYILLFSASLIVLIFPAKFVINNWLVEYNESQNVLLLLFSAQYVSIMVRCIHINLYKAKKEQNRYFIIMLGIVILSIILNILLYLCFKDMNAIAIATLITNIIWFICGEIDFEDYRMTPKDYIFLIIMLITFLVCGNISNAILGLIVYIITEIVAIFALERNIAKEIVLKLILFMKERIQKTDNIQ